MNVYRHAAGNQIRKSCVVELDLDIEEDDLLPTMSHRQQIKPHTSEDSYPESDDLQDSLEEEVIADSGLGSSSEKPISVSDEIAKFQQEIMKAEEAKCRDSSWQKLKANRRGSMDSALDADSDNSSIPPGLPPKERFKSEDALSAPALPPKKKTSKKRISFSIEEATVFGSDQESNCSQCPSSPTGTSSSTSPSSAATSISSLTSPSSSATVFYSQDFYSQNSSSKQKPWLPSSVSSLNTTSKNNKNIFNSQQNIINNKTSEQNNKQNHTAVQKQNNNQLLKQKNVSLINANNNFLTKQNNICLERTRQIEPQTHLAPQYPPDCFDKEMTNKDEIDEPNDGVEARNMEVTNPPPILPSVKDLANKFLQKEIPEPKPRAMLQKKQEKGEKIPEMLKVKKEKYQQVHSLTARSVSREFREGLRQGKPMMTDTIVKLPSKHKTPDFTQKEIRETSHSGEETIQAVTSRGENMTSRGEDASHVVSNNNHVAKVTVVYDSVRNNDMFPDGEYIRTPSPEHVGIPAGPLKMPMRRLESTDGYTSEDSNGSFPPTSQRHPPPRRKMRPPPVDKNVWA